MKLLDQFFTGRELRDPSLSAPLPLDFAVSTSISTLCLQADWWTTDWGWGKGLLVVGSELQDEGRFEGLDPALQIASPSDETFQKLCDDARYRTDVDRTAYLTALTLLQAFEPDFDLGPWIEAVKARPVIDARAVFEQRVAALRPIGRIRMLDEQDAVIDALVIDEHGNSAVIDVDGWFSLFADEWSGYDEAARPDLESYLSFVLTKQPRGALALTPLEVFQDEGDLATHAVRSLITAT